MMREIHDNKGLFAVGSGAKKNKQKTPKQNIFLR